MVVMINIDDNRRARGACQNAATFDYGCATDATIRPNLSRMSPRSLLRAKIAIHSPVTDMSKPVSLNMMTFAVK